jgi:hypothetical protein
VGDLPLGGLKHGNGSQPELAEQDSGKRVTVRVAGHLQLPVSCDRHAVQVSGADLPVHVGCDFPVMLGAERARQLGLHGLGSAEGCIQPGVLARRRLIALVDLVRQENGLGFAMGSKRDGLRRRSCRNRARIPESRCRTSDSWCTWTVTGRVTTIAY